MAKLLRRVSAQAPQPGASNVSLKNVEDRLRRAPGGDDGNFGGCACGGFREMRAVTAPERRRLPLVDRPTLDRLEDQLENPSAVRTFVHDFVQAWEERYSRLVSDIEHRSEVAALDAILSIRTTSSMVGAARLAQLASGLEDLIRVGEFPAAAEMLPRLNSCALRTTEALLLGDEASTGEEVPG